VRVILTAGVLEAFDDEQARRVESDGALKKPFEASALLAAVKPLAEAAAKARGEATPGSAAVAPSKAKPEVPFVAVVDAEQVHAAVTVAVDACMQTMVDQISRRVLAALRSANAEPRIAESRVPTPRLPGLRVPESRVPESRAPVPPAPESRVPESRVAEPPAPESRVPESPVAVPHAPGPTERQSRAAAAGIPELPAPAPPPSEAPKPAAPPVAAKRSDPVRRPPPPRIRSGSILGLDIGEPEPPTPEPE